MPTIKYNKAYYIHIDCNHWHNGNPIDLVLQENYKALGLIVIPTLAQGGGIVIWHGMGWQSLTLTVRVNTHTRSQ